jgi:CRP/FNR family transcriptional regulator, cyclic AMP receptor protein
MDKRDHASNTGNAATKDAYLLNAMRASAWFATLPIIVQRDMLLHLKIHRYAPGDLIFEQGEQPLNLCGLISGTAHTVATSHDGHAVLLSMLRDGDWTGYIGQIDRQANSFSVIAATEVEAVILSNKAVEAIFFGSPERLRLIVEPLMAVLRYAYTYLVETNWRPPRRVVAQRLIDLSRTVSLPKQPIGLALDSVSQEDIAAATYLTRPTVNRILGELAQEGAIKLGYGRIDIVDADALIAATQLVRGAKPAPAAAPAVPKRPVSVTARLSPSRLNEILMSGLWFSSLPPEVRTQIMTRLEVRKYAAGAALCQQGAATEGVSVVLTGQCRTLGRATDGNESLISLLHPGVWTAFAPALDDGPHAFSVVASRASVAGLLPNAALVEIFGQSTALYQRLAAPAIQFLRFVYHYLIETNGRPPAQLIAQRLYDLACVVYDDAATPRDFLDSLNQSDIASATGLSRQTVSKVLQDLTAKGVIDLGYRRITILDPVALLAAAHATNG